MLVCLSLMALVVATGAVHPRITAPGCGQTPAARDQAAPRIVGGSQATPYSWPFICSLEIRGYHICAGSLVKNLNGTYYFVTAAHCASRASRFYTVSCSIHDRLGSNPYRQTFSLSSVINHENYNANTYSNDISVMVLSSQPKENDYLQPVCVASRDYFGGENAVVMGWGATSEGGSSTRILMEVTKPVLADIECTSAYGSAFDGSTMMCSGFMGIGGVSFCKGDNGGPLVAYRNNAWELIGVVSWQNGCARPHFPGVYADVWRLRNWLSSKIN